MYANTFFCVEVERGRSSAHTVDLLSSDCNVIQAIWSCVLYTQSALSLETYQFL
jgi:hypothetical protein